MYLIANEEDILFIIILTMAVTLNFATNLRPACVKACKLKKIDFGPVQVISFSKVRFLSVR